MEKGTIMEYAEEDIATSDEGTLERLREAGEKYAAMVASKELLESELKDLNKQINTMKIDTIPDLMREAGVDLIGVPDMGVNIRLEMYCKASIPLSWPPTKRQKAFDHLREIGGADLIKSELSLKAAKGNDDKMRELAQRVDQLAAEYGIQGHVQIDDTVAWNGLTAFVKQAMQDGQSVDLEALGAHYGEVAKITDKE